MLFSDVSQVAKAVEYVPMTTFQWIVGILVVIFLALMGVSHRYYSSEVQKLSDKINGFFNHISEVKTGLTGVETDVKWIKEILKRIESKLK